MESPWQIGNTTVRNPERLRGGLTVLLQKLNGNLISTGQEIAFANALEQAGKVDIKNKDRDYSDMGRKWRACFTQLGLISPKLSRYVEPFHKDPKLIQVLEKYRIPNLTGIPYEVTPNGIRLINAETVRQQQECMLRALLAYEIPSVMERSKSNTVFKPLVFMLQLLEGLSELDKRGLSLEEIAIAQSCHTHEGIKDTCKRIIAYRIKRDDVSGRVNKKKVDNELIEELATDCGLKANTLIDYADTCQRYLRFTGLFSLKSSRLVLNTRKIPFVNKLLESEPEVIGSNQWEKYLNRLWNGSAVPTDEEGTAISEVIRFQELLLEAGVAEEEILRIPIEKDIKELNVVRLKLEEQYQNHLEKEFARIQSTDDQLDEIIAYMKKLNNPRADIGDLEIIIDDAPAYLEWTVWRAFLAINKLVNGPSAARKFNVDQDFFPLGCAPGGGPDMFFEFEKYGLAVEVTLTSSSRQEASEGESVRRHVFKEKEKMAKVSGKPVYGLFLAKTIDNNTAETFRIGVWYQGDEPDYVNIVPFTLEQFIILLERFKKVRFENDDIMRLLEVCLISRNTLAPTWKKEIQKSIEKAICW